MRLTTSRGCLLLSVVDRALIASSRIPSPHLVAACISRAVADVSLCGGGFDAPRNAKNRGGGEVDCYIHAPHAAVCARRVIIVFGPTYRAAGIL